LACSLGCFIYQYPSTCHINDIAVSRHQSFIELLKVFDDEGIECIVTQIFPNTWRVFPHEIVESHIFLPYANNSRGWEILFKENLLHAIPSSNGTRKNGEKSCFAAPFKEKGKAFNLTCFLSTPCDFMPMQTMWNSLRWVWGSSLASPLNIGSGCINSNLRSKLTLLSIIIHNSWFSMLGATSSLSVCCRATTMVLMRASFHNLCKMFSILKSTCTCRWLVDQVTCINSQEN